MLLPSHIFAIICSLCTALVEQALHHFSLTPSPQIHALKIEKETLEGHIEKLRAELETRECVLCLKPAKHNPLQQVVVGLILYCLE